MERFFRHFVRATRPVVLPSQTGISVSSRRHQMAGWARHRRKRHGNAPRWEAGGGVDTAGIPVTAPCVAKGKVRASAANCIFRHESRSLTGPLRALCPPGKLTEETEIYVSLEAKASICVWKWLVVKALCLSTNELYSIVTNSESSWRGFCRAFCHTQSIFWIQCLD